VNSFTAVCFYVGRAVTYVPGLYTLPDEGLLYLINRRAVPALRY